jgi:hypothetical protein
MGSGQVVGGVVGGALLEALSFAAVQLLLAGCAAAAAAALATVRWRSDRYHARVDASPSLDRIL